MYFKPRIFISSTLDLTSIRNEIREHLESAGAEVMLYEDNLTPSIRPATYRQDVLEADFIIFVFHNRYGSKTEQGISGINEEWLIVKDTNIPKHVYVRKATKGQEKRLQTFVTKELSKNRISYYYYSNRKDLMRRIKGTVFSIAKEIAVNKLEALNVEAGIIRSAKAKSDYAKGIQFIKQIDETIELSNIGMCDLIESTVICSIIEPWEYDSRRNRGAFIDEKLNDSFKEMLTAYNSFLKLHQNNYTSSGESRTIKLKWSQTEVSYRELKAGANSRHGEVQERLQSFLKQYVDFKQLVQEMWSATEIVV